MTIEQKKDVVFPTKRFLCGAIIEGFIVFLMAIDKHVEFAFMRGFLLACVVSFLPYFITHRRNLKKQESVFWWCFFGTFIPFGLVILIITTLYSLFAERNNFFIKEKNKNKTKLSTQKMKSVVDKIKHFPKKVCRVAIVVIFAILCLAVYQKSNYDKEKEELGIIYFDDCKKSNDEFMKEYGVYMDSERAKSLMKSLTKKCYCDYEAIFMSFKNPFNAIKHARHITKQLDSWRSYYKIKEPDFMARWESQRKLCERKGI